MFVGHWAGRQEESNTYAVHICPTTHVVLLCAIVDVLAKGQSRSKRLKQGITVKDVGVGRFQAEFEDENACSIVVYRRSVALVNEELQPVSYVVGSLSKPLIT
jgi:hypothetical protein